ncbi:AbrB/MazE/SpoVT family DNA-binding domain-containing protein [Mesorhizobium captivum]|uniref:AbrB/MazE/SpoVT family DNA-binding domain-containing protein n=1 Tax=Mesorhizobium captivum TaxID=3072319 RepID=UPI003D3239A6
MGPFRYYQAQMARSEKLTTTVSTNGQVTLPSAMRKRRGWGAGMRLQAEDTPEGVLLKPVPA